MRNLNDGVLARSARSFRQALRHLPASASEPSVRKIRRGLSAVERELERREASPEGDSAPDDGRVSDRSASAKPEGVAQTAPGDRSSERNAPSEEAAPAVTSEGDAPLFRLIPQLTGTFSKAVSVLSGDGTVRYQSEPVKWLLGFDAEELVGERLAEFVQPRSQEPLEAGVARMQAREEKFDSWRVQFRTASGGRFWLEGMASNFLGDPRLGGILVYWRELAGRSSAHR